LPNEMFSLSEGNVLDRQRLGLWIMLWDLWLLRLDLVGMILPLVCWYWVMV
jgi:hypothetical protein